MKSTLFNAVSTMALFAVFSAAASADPIDDAAPQAISMTGTTSFDGWNNLTSTANPGYPGFPGSGAWPSPIGSNVAGSGDAIVSKVSGNIFPSSTGLYFGSFTAVPNTNAGTLGVTDSTIVSGLKTVVFQVETGESMGYDFYNGVLPTLSYNGGSQALAATFSDKLVQAPNGTFDSPVGPQPLYVNLWALQWDLSSIVDPITSLNMGFNGVTHSQVFGLQLDQSSTAYSSAVFAAPVPEPASMAALSLGALALIRRKRRNK